MKSKFSKILGVGLTLALLTSLLLTAPVAALTQPDVTVDDNTISVETSYSIVFSLGKQLPEGGKIVIEFPTGTDLTNVAATDVKLSGTSGIGSGAFSDEVVTTIVKSPDAATGPEVTITVPTTITMNPDNDYIGVGTMVQVVVEDVLNPDAAGDYTLDVSTLDSADDEIEAAVTSSPYTLEVPTIPGLPGVASVYNPTGVLMAQENNLADAIAAAGPDYTIQVGPGTYTLLSTETLGIAHEGLTFVSTNGAANTIIDGSAVTQGHVINISADDVTVEGFTVEGNGATANVDGIWIRGGWAGATVKDNVFTDTKIGIVLTWDSGFPTYIVDGATVSGNVIEDSYAGIATEGCTKDSTISDNTITDSSGRGISFTAGTTDDKTQGNTISGNIITGSGDRGIYVKVAADSRDFFDDNVIKGNTISGGEFRGIEIQIEDADNLDITNLVITGNDITDNEGGGILAEIASAGSYAIKFNTITGNDINTGDYGIKSTVVVDATLNWWGTDVAADIADMVSATDITYEPFLTGADEAVFSATDAAVGAASLDAKDTVGIVVSLSGATAAGTISVAEYIDNPQEPVADALAFFDVYVDETTITIDKVTIKFYVSGIDENTGVKAWSAGTDEWTEVAGADFSAYGGYVWIDLTADTTPTIADLSGTPFVLVAAEEAVGEIEEITAPVVGAVDVSTLPTLAWKAVADATYEIQIAQDATFAILDEAATSPTNAYIVTTALAEGQSYYWRVRAVTDAGAGDWATGVFTTATPEPEPTPPITIEKTEPPEITIEMPQTVTQAINPGLLWAIIGVGAVLVIALIVLIVRTRRAV